MKKIISTALATLMLATTFVSCAPAADQLDPAITLASSDAVTYAEWLDGRLDTIPDDVVIGVGSNEAYGIDMTNFESDGYIVREIEGDVLIFGATANGTDRAVRKYAKAAEIGQTANLDEIYHEGNRVGKITLAGRDISEYTIYTPDEANMKKGAGEMARLIKQACGAVVPTSTETPTAPYIEYRYVTDESLSTVGYRYTVTEDGMVIECSDEYKSYSSLFATWRILENELDWFCLTYGDSNLAYADQVDIPAGTSGTETNAFEFFNLYGTLRFGDYDTDRAHSSYNYGLRIQSCHGMQGNRFAGELSDSPNKNWLTDQPCFTDEEFYEISKRDIATYISNRLASGSVIGENFVEVDISHGDNSNWCTCGNCRKAHREEGGTNAGPLVRWANRLTEALDAVPEYTGLTYGIFAYAGTNRAPRKTAPNEHIYVTYCFDWNCSNHPLDGDDCTTGAPIGYPKSYEDNRSNPVMSRFLEDWTRISNNVFVWYYVLEDTLMTMNFLHNTYDNIKYLHEIGVRGIFRQTCEGFEAGFGNNRVAEVMCAALQWDIDMTEEEYEVYYVRVLQDMFGEGWENVYEFYETLGELYVSAPCSACWFWCIGVSPTYNFEAYTEEYDRLFYLLEETIPMAESALQERWFDYMSCENIYKGSLASYWRAYEAYDDERVEVLKERYAMIDERIQKYGLDMTTNMPSWGGGVSYKKELEIQAWTSLWATYSSQWIGVDVTREMPEHIKEYIESVAADAATATE